MLEMTVVMAILIVCVSIFSQIVTSTARLRAVSRERCLAANSARKILEALRNEPLHEVFNLYNASKADDPGGYGTGPGNQFAVRGLDPLTSDTDGFVGEIVFPAAFVPEGATTGYVPKGSVDEKTREATTTPSAPVTGRWMLREDLDMPELGMPRDLNGDVLVDGSDHRFDARIIPVCVRLEWKGRYGDRSMQVYTLLTNYEPGDKF